jgi:hypothetical protein
MMLSKSGFSMPRSIRDFQAVSVDRVAFFENPFRCAHAARFSGIVERHGADGEVAPGECVGAGAEFFTSLTEGRLRLV